MTCGLLPIEFKNWESDDVCITMFDVTFTQTWGVFERGLKATVVSFYPQTAKLVVHVVGADMTVIDVKLEMK